LPDRKGRRIFGKEHCGNPGSWGNQDWNSDSGLCHKGSMFKAFSKTFWLFVAVVIACGLGVFVLWAFVLK
jgi:hypothetical protein